MKHLSIFVYNYTCNIYYTYALDGLAITFNFINFCWKEVTIPYFKYIYHSFVGLVLTLRLHFNMNI